MNSETAIKEISRLVVCLHPGQLKCGCVFPMAMTDFAHDDKLLDEWKKSFIEGGGACIYDGPLQIGDKKP